MSTIPEQRCSRARAATAPRERVLFTDFRETQPTTATAGGREWFITPTSTGWRLEFTDPGDERPTYAGTFATIRAAKQEARR